MKQIHQATLHADQDVLACFRSIGPLYSKDVVMWPGLRRADQTGVVAIVNHGRNVPSDLSACSALKTRT
jgi:hypothetical protein